MAKKAKISKCLFTFWKLLFSIFSLGTSICMGYLQGVLEIDVLTMPSKFQLVLIAIIILVFIPLLLFIKKKSIQDNTSEISDKTTKLIWTLGIASGGNLLCNLLSVFFPGLF